MGTHIVFVKSQPSSLSRWLVYGSRNETYTKFATSPIDWKIRGAVLLAAPWRFVCIQEPQLISWKHAVLNPLARKLSGHGQRAEKCQQMQRSCTGKLSTFFKWARPCRCLRLPSVVCCPPLCLQNSSGGCRRNGHPLLVIQTARGVCTSISGLPMPAETSRVRNAAHAMMLHASLQQIWLSG